MAVNSSATGTSASTAQRSAMQNARFVSHMSSSHQPHKSSTPSQGIYRNCVKNVPR